MPKAILMGDNYMTITTISGKPLGRIGFGAMGLSKFYLPTPSRGEALNILGHAVELGYRIFDTALAYGDNESLLGEFLSKVDINRNDLIIATKCGSYLNDDDKVVLDGSQKHILAACDNARNKLGIDIIDIFYLHRVDSKVPVAESMAAMAKLVDQKKIRYPGISEVNGDTISIAYNAFVKECRSLDIEDKNTPVLAVQNEYSLANRYCEEALTDSPHDADTVLRGSLQACAEIGAVLFAYSPLARSVLVSEERREWQDGDFRKGGVPYARGDNYERNLARMKILQKIAAEANCSPSQVCLAFLRQRGEELGVQVVPIPGTTKYKHLMDNFGATSIELTKDALERLKDAYPIGFLEGERYSY